MKKKAVIDTSVCVACGCCLKACPLGAISIPVGIHAVINTEKCVGCGKCTVACPASIIHIAVQDTENIGCKGGCK